MVDWTADLGTTPARILDEPECAKLISTQRLGRIATTRHALPIIIPVVYGCLDEDIIFRVSSGILQRAASDAHVVCFQTDHAGDSNFQSSWSVSVIGSLSLLKDPLKLIAARELPLGPWNADTFIALKGSLYSGRSLGSSPTDHASSAPGSPADR